MATQLIGISKRRSWTRELVIETIQYRYQHQAALNPQRLQAEDASLLAAGRRYFGSWPKALEAASVPPVHRPPAHRHQRGYWTRELLISEIHRHASIGEPLYAHAMQQIDNCLVSAATYHFGSWSEALTAAGFDADVIRANHRHSTDSVITEIREIMKEQTDVRDIAIRTQRASLYWASRKYFGSWRNALAAARQSINLDTLKSE